MLYTLLLTLTFAALAQHESINAHSEYSSISRQRHSAFQDLSSLKNSDVPDSNSQLKAHPQSTRLIMSSASLDRSNGIPTPGLSLMNTTASLARVMLVSSGSEKIAEVDSHSRLNVRDTHLIADTLSTAPFVSSGNVLLSGLGIEFSSEHKLVDTLCEGMIGEDKESVGWIAFENSKMEDLIVGNPMKKGLVSGGVHQKEVVRGVQFANISSNTATEDEQPEHEESWVLMSRMKDCAVSDSFDSVHGGIVAGVGGRSVGGFECSNSSFVDITREREMYGNRRERRNAFEQSGVRTGTMNSASDCDIDMDQHKTYVADQGDVYTFTNTIYPECNATTGGAIHIQGAFDNTYYFTLEITNCYFQRCKTTKGDGGAICAYTLTLANFTNTTFLKCNATGNGGAIHLDRDSRSAPYLTITIERSTFSECKTGTVKKYSGGGVCAYYLTDAKIINSKFSKCESTGNGGSLFLDRNETSNLLVLTVEDCTFTSSKTTGTDYDGGYSGGAVCAVYLDVAKIINSTFSKCEATGNGGSLFLSRHIGWNSIKLTIESCYFSDSKASESGGAVDAYSISTSTIKNSTFYNCAAEGLGGALCLWRSGGTLTFRDTQFTENYADAYSDIYLNKASNNYSFTADSAVFLSNTYTYPCRGSTTNYNSVSNQFQCGDFDYDIFFIATSPGQDATCKSESNTACRTLSAAFSKGRALVITLKMVDGTFHATSGLSIGSKTVIVTVADDDYVTYALDASNINYFTATTGNLTLREFTLVPTQSSYSASIIKIDGGVLILKGMEMSGFSGNVPAVDYTGSNLRIAECAFENIANTNTNGDGSVIYAVMDKRGGSVVIEDSYFEHCKSKGWGGALCFDAFNPNGSNTLYSYTVDISACTFSRCTSDYGGAVFAMYLNVAHIIDSEFYSCTSTYHGGSLCLDRNTANDSPLELTIECCNFTNSKAINSGVRGGAVCACYLTTANIQESTFTGCSSGGCGGSLYFSTFNNDHRLELTVAGCTFTECTTGTTTNNNGGAVFADFLASACIKNTVIEDCTANDQGGALYLGGYSFRLEITGCGLFSCAATSGSGGVVYAANCYLVLLNYSRFDSNTANVTGGALYLQLRFGTVSIVDTIFMDNSAPNPGTDIWLSSPSSFNFKYTEDFEPPTSTKPCTDDATNYPELSKLLCQKPTASENSRSNSDDEGAFPTLLHE